jgi:hypothetical protein
VPERDKRRECQFYWRERCAAQVLAGRPLPVGYNKTSMGYGEKKVGRV